MASCYWTQPAQLHPWYKLDSLKRKHPPMLPRSESPSPVDEYDSDPRAKRQRRATLDQTRPIKRKIPSPPQSPTEDPDSSGSDDPRLFKRQRCTTLERGIERLSLTNTSTTALPPVAQAQALAPSTPTSLTSAVPVHHQHEHHVTHEFAHSHWPEISPSLPLLPSLLPPPFSTSTSITSASYVVPLTVDADAITDVKMHSSSWYEPEKDRIVVTDLDTSSDDEADIVDQAPKLPHSVLQALLRGPLRGDPPLSGLLSSPVLPRLALQPQASPPLLDLDPGSIFEPWVDEAMQVEQ